MGVAKVWEEKINIPTYGVGEPDKNPMFFEKRVYQGSTGKVYPYPVIDKIYDVKEEKEYKAVFLENEYLKVMVLPELGGRIQRAYDKTNGYDFVYYNQVIKPALVGLTGPWVSGGIEFNWPQHHRPGTFLPTEYTIKEYMDGSCAVLINDVDRINGTKCVAEIKLYPGKAYIEINARLYNRTSLPQTFLWWANPAVAVNDNTQSVFPPDVHAVMDHGKRDVSKFPIATGVYYKHDYGRGVDISRYKNIPVPTSYMADKSEFDFVGGYDYGREAGILHVADHHISPGKKQWTWGCGDFGKAWDRNLTDEDGPYIELMTGVFTDNQPDFTWLKPFEEKTFTQYFMPYKQIGYVKNASTKAAVNMEFGKDTIRVRSYATSVYERVNIILKYKDEVLFSEEVTLSPEDIFDKVLDFVLDGILETDFSVSVKHGREMLVEYRPLEKKIEKIPSPAEAAKEPSEIATNEELYLTGLHIEQYRHATYLPEDYYMEGLKRDPGDIRIGNAYGSLLLRRGDFENAHKYLTKALERLTWKNPNPYNSEPYYNLGLANMFLDDDKAAFDNFYKATWTFEQQEMSWFYLGVLASKKGDFEAALDFLEKSLVRNTHNIKARSLKSAVLRILGRTKEAEEWINENLKLDEFDHMSRIESYFLRNEKIFKDASVEAVKNEKEIETFLELTRGEEEAVLQLVRDYGEAGFYKEALWVLMLGKERPMIEYYKGYYFDLIGDREAAFRCIRNAESLAPDYTFPNKLEDIAVLKHASSLNPDGARAYYYLGNLYYDKRQYDKARELWEKSVAYDDSFATVHRNLALVYFNKADMAKEALWQMEKAFSLNEKDARVFMELDQLYKKMGKNDEERFEMYEKYYDIVLMRDDLCVEYATLLNMLRRNKEAYDFIMAHKFHPWEGGEGRVTTQYTTALTELVKKDLKAGLYEEAVELLTKALVYPENLGEGKLEGTKDNHIYYYLGIAYKALGRSSEAEECLNKACEGDENPAGMMYYNDQPADMILYKGLAYKELGNEDKATSLFNKLVDYGERHVYDEVKIEYFAVSLPDLQIFEDDLTKKNEAHCYYLIGLGKLGLGEIEKAKEYLGKTFDMDKNHQKCKVYLDMCEV